MQLRNNAKRSIDELMDGVDDPTWVIKRSKLFHLFDELDEINILMENALKTEFIRILEDLTDLNQDVIGVIVKFLV